MFTIKNDVDNELIIKKSKFITYLFYIDNIDEVNIKINELKNKYKDASHYCYAYVIDNYKKFDDDNEPNSTAGAPILSGLDKNNLNHVLCVVVRYFGGIKLGANGLIRAYRKSVSDCLKKAEIVELINGYNIEIEFDYSNEKTVNSIVNNIISKSFNERIIYILDVDINTLEKLKLIDNINIKIIKNILIKK